MSKETLILCCVALLTGSNCALVKDEQSNTDVMLCVALFNRQ